MAKTRTIPIETLRQLFDCDFTNGNLVWKRRPQEMFSSKKHCNIWNARFVGKRAFTYKRDDGYFTGAIFNKPYRAHRIVFAMYHGVWPKHEIDHINHDRADNCIANLREVTRQENTKNASIPKDNSSGVIGVWRHVENKKWVAEIKHNKTKICLGHYAMKEDAIAARKAAEVKYGFHQNHGLAKEATQA